MLGTLGDSVEYRCQSDPGAGRGYEGAEYFYQSVVVGCLKEVYTAPFLWACPPCGQLGSRGQTCRYWRLEVQDAEAQEDVYTAVYDVGFLWLECRG